MTSLHMVGHMVTVAVIATLVKQLMQLKFNLHDLKVELCDQETNAAEFKNNFCERGGKHGSEEGGDKSSESEIEAKTKAKRKSETKSGTSTDTGVATGTNSDKDTGTKTEMQNEVEATETARITKTGQQKTDSETETRTEIGTADISADMDWYSEAEHHVPFESSVWCHEPENGFCQFQNLCYNTVEDDLFILAGNESVFENVDFSDGTILIELSSVRKHNVHQKYVGSIPVDKSERLNITWIKDTVLLFNRFKPDNLMHVLHDDILPMFHSMRLISMKEGNRQGHQNEKLGNQLVFFEGWEMGEFGELYQLFSTDPIVLKENLNLKGTVVCFANAYTGVSKSTVWYDYGFTKPQGPVDGFEVTGMMIHSLVKYILQQLHSGDNKQRSSTDYLVLLTRKQNRKIINEVELTLDIVQKLGIKVLNVNFEMFEFSKLIHIVHSSKGIIGMHGSLLSLAMFLRPGSVLVELFPYAVNPDHYTPFKTLASIKGMGIAYRAWQNTNTENSVGYPERDPDEGGLNHVPEAERTEIMQQTEVPLHLCCTDPSWLYHIYQDTSVDVGEITSLISSSLEKSEKYSDQPGLSFHSVQVKNVSCILSILSDEGKGISWKLIVTWKIPWNFELLGKNDVQYEILVQNMADTSAVKSYVTETSPFIIDLDTESSYYVWVKSVRDKTLSGPYSDSTECITG